MARSPLAFPPAGDLRSLFITRVREHGDRLAYAYVRDTLEISGALTYEALYDQAAGIACEIERRTAPHARILLAHPPGLEFARAFWACVLSGRVAVPVPAPDPTRFRNAAPRLRSIIEDCHATLTLTTPELLEPAHTLGDDVLGRAPWHAWSDPPARAEPACAQTSAQDVAYLQYTSGSTGDPRGAVLTHANVLAQCHGATEALQIRSDSRLLCWLPHYHDYGLVSGLLWPLYVGATGYLMSPLTFLRRPLRWLEAIEHYGITHSGAPNFAYAACLRALGATPGWQGRLHSLVSLSCGAEPIRHDTIRQFEAAFGPHGLSPCAFTPGYGMAETVLTVTVKQPGTRYRAQALDPDALAQGHARPIGTDAAADGQGEPVGTPSGPARACHVVGCGHPVSHAEVRIVDAHTGRVLPERQVGEIWVRGATVGQGYWQRGDENRATFGAATADGQGPFLRTGDLGFMFDAELFVTGRLKDLVIVHGKNLYPQDIEWTAQRTSEQLRQGYGAAFSVDGEDGEELVLVQELEHRVDAADMPLLVQSIRRAIGREHEIPVRAVALVRAGTIPRTSSGKLRRGRCKQAFLDGSLAPLLLDVQAPDAQDDPVATPESIAARWQARLQVAPGRTDLWLQALQDLIAVLGRAPSGAVPPEWSVIECGLDSLKTFRLVELLRAAGATDVGYAHVLGAPSLSWLAGELACSPPPVAQPAPALPLCAISEEPGELPLSPAQEGVWVVQQLAATPGIYNLAQLQYIDGPLDADALRRAVQAVVDEQDALRCSIKERAGRAVQSVAPHVEVELPIEHLPSAQGTQADWIEQWAISAAREEFDLARPPLLRVRLLRLSDRRHVLVLVTHHLVGDGWSIAVLARRVEVVYRSLVEGAVMPASASRSYTDHAISHRQWLSSDEGRRHLDHWKQRLRGLLPLDLPTDRPRPAQASYRGGMVRATLPPPLVLQLERVAQENDCTLFMVLLAGFQALLMRYTGQDDIAVGVPCACRPAGFSHTVGFFSNTVVMRTDLSQDPSFAQLLTRVRATALDAYDHQAYPSDRLVSELGLARDLSRNTLYQVAFGLQNFADTAIRLAGTQVRAQTVHTGTAKTDLWVAYTHTPDGLLGEFEYASDLFDAASIERMAAHLRTLLEAAALAPQTPLSRLPLLSEEERRQVLVDWNRTTRDDYPLDTPVHELVRTRCRQRPEGVAVEFGAHCMTYRALDDLSDRLAAHLQALSVGRHGIVGVAMERCLQLPVALLGVLKAGAAFLPLDPDYPPERLAFMLRDSNAAVVLTHTPDRPPWASGVAGCPIVHVDLDALARMPSPTLPRDAGPCGAAYVIYTSGSTGRPKGAVLPHRGLVNHLCWLRDVLGLDEHDRILQKTSISFDASVWEFFAPWITGGRVVLCRPGDHRDPAALAATIQAHGVTVLQMVPSALRALLAEPQLARCSSLRHLVCGGEALDRGLARSALACLPQVRIGNFYGPTEASDDTTHWEVGPGDLQGEGTVPLGRPIANTRCHVLDRHLQPVPPGVAGELYIAGAGLALGYLHRPELTAERFVADPFRPGERLYRSGDLARYRADGVIEYLGRLDFQVKVRGFRVELGEVEAALLACPGVTECAVVPRWDAHGSSTLVAYVVGSGSVDAHELKRRVRHALPDHMVPAAIVPLPALPRLVNGKLDRRALPVEAAATEDEDRGLPRGPIEAALMEIWSDVLPGRRFGIHDNFFDLGGHSLSATQVVSRVRDALRVELALRDVFEHPTVAGLAARIEAGRQPAAMPPIVRQPRTAPLAVSFSQRRMWLVQQFAPLSTAYHMPNSLRMRGRLDAEALEDALRTLVRRHEAFRTTFALDAHEPVQRISEDPELPIERADFSSLGPDPALAEARRWLSREAQQPFDLARGPLHRVRLARLADDDHVLMWLVHHTIGDQWSGAVLLSELAQLYRPGGRPAMLEALEVEYADYAAWQRELHHQQALHTQLTYWRHKLQDLQPLALPLDRPRPVVPTHRGSHVLADLPAETLAAVRRLGALAGATPFMTLLACFQLLLSRYTGQHDIAVGSPIANRTHSSAERLVGTLVNTLVMRTSLDGVHTFRELIARTRETALEAYAHQDVPYDYLVEQLNASRGAAAPLEISVLFNVLNAPLSRTHLEGLTLEPFEVDRGGSQFDLSLHIDTEWQERIYLEYSSDVFDERSAQMLVQNYLHLLRQVLEDPDAPLDRCSAVSPSQRDLLLAWNANAAPLEEVTVDRLLERQAQRTPERIALDDGTRRLTYAALDERSGHLAQKLRERGVRRGALVGLCVERDVDMVVAQWAVLRAGGAYVPLDPHYPPERLSYMAQDAGIALLLTQSHLADRIGWPRADSLWLDTDLGAPPTVSGPAFRSNRTDADAATPEDPAYVIYTSGSTGRPKGVVVPHRAVVNFLASMAREPGLRAEDRLLAVTTLSFDIAVLELLLPLTVGARVVIASRAQAADAARLAEIIESHDITMMQATPSTWHMLLDAGWPGRRPLTALVGGEALQPELARQILERTSALWNMYGPTETTVWSTCCRIDSADGVVSIGRPIANTSVWVLDAQRRPCPIGVPGEIYIGGAGVATGYLHRPELTAERFVDDAQVPGPGGRLYRTGDLGRWRSDGRLEHLGRLDFQVKIRGHRIELGEIETQLCRHPQVARALVIARQFGVADTRLVAYVMPRDGTPAASAWRDFLRASLPDYMLPQHFVVMQEWPLLPNGKVDRSQLPAPSERRDTLPSGAPRTREQKAVAEVWQQLLGVPSVGLTDNFFDLGGHSLLAVRAIAEIENRLQVRVDASSLLYETLEQVAAHAHRPSPEKAASAV